MRGVLLSCLALALPLVGQPAAARAASDGSELVGTWTCDVEGYKEIWTIKQDKNDWSITGVYTKDGQEVGSFVGANAKLLPNGVLEFVKDYVKKPNPTWPDRTTILLKTGKDNKLIYTWRHRRRAGTRMLEPAEK
jgi:hypothetical protein